MVSGIKRGRLREPFSYRPLDAEKVLSYLRTLGIFDRKLGGMPSQWRADECGDGNLNLIFVVRGPLGAIVVKQALPYVRMVGESWPLSVRRNFFEHAAFLQQVQWAAEFVPAIYYSDEGMALIVMEFLTSHCVLRSEFIRARMYRRVGEHLGRFLARTLFNSSELRLSGHSKKERMAVFLTNTEMCRISEDLIFDEPYYAAPMNRHTTPQLDCVVDALKRDAELKVAVQGMKWNFSNQPECLIHGDLHTGSVMVTDSDTRIIDPEFASYGPMGFDIGVLFANFLMAYFSQRGHAARAGDRDEFETYLLHQLTTIWTTFVAEFSLLWHERGPAGDANSCNPRLDLDSPTFSDRALTLRLRQIWHDALGFAGCEVIRRIVGLAHISDFEAIVDLDRRAGCEQRAVRLARSLLLERPRCLCISDLTAQARACE